MKANKLSTIQNLCSQGNITKSNKCSLFQYNYIVMMGLEHINNNIQDIEPIPIVININRTGELEIVGIDEDILSNRDNIRIYTGKKVTHSKI